MVPLGLFEGDAVGPIDDVIPYPDYGMCRIENIEPAHPINAGLGRSFSVLYYWGPGFVPEPETQVSVLGTYSAAAYTAMMAFEYGAGRVFIIG